MRRPVFASEEIDRQRKQAIANLGVSLEDPGFVAGAVLNRLIYGFHPYGFPDSGMPDTIAKISREDLREFHRRYFTPNNSILAIVGDVTARSDDAACGAFATARQPYRPALHARQSQQVASSSHKRIRCKRRAIGQSRSAEDPDYWISIRAIRILGGEGSRLFKCCVRARLKYSESRMNAISLA